MAKNLERLGRTQEALREYEVALDTARRTSKSSDMVDEIAARISALKSGMVTVRLSPSPEPSEMSPIMTNEGKEFSPLTEKDDSTTAETTSDDDGLSRALAETQKYFELAKSFREKQSFSAAKECLKECGNLLRAWEDLNDPVVRGLRLRTEGLWQLIENDEAIYGASEAAVDAVKIGYAAEKSPLTLRKT
eukprot:CAMPEP_0194061678 /NCGR_PEP_ID=MMETSP0009_2-20130614/75277_1 /TAXON_ID=210454 /ORGANISM="Grammatophora oceanica, Strain CCMP 410" /LENGTH=190 /DNA_ID=CAMNT_0038713099 /DNA_START=71 /DNA_END=639 /DNA_ORIENTATION=+